MKHKLIVKGLRTLASVIHVVAVENPKAVAALGISIPDNSFTARYQFFLTEPQIHELLADLGAIAEDLRKERTQSANVRKQEI